MAAFGWALRLIVVCASVGIVSHHYQVHFFHWGSADHSLSQLASLGFLEELPFLFKIKYEGFILLLSL